MGTHNSSDHINAHDAKINKYVIAGGGTAGWFSAAILSRALINTGCKIELIESPNIPTIGVGEATIPSIIDVLNYLQIPIKDFIIKTNATFKLGIKFIDWHTIGEHYWHQFGYVGGKMDNRHFYQHWLKYHLHGGSHEFTDFSPSIAMAKANKFFINNPNNITNLSPSTFALHFDAGLVAKYLEAYCINNGVTHTKAHIRDVSQKEDGQIDFVTLNNGKQIDGDFFIDCSGQHALLIEKTLGIPLENWQKYLPVDRAVAMQSETMTVRPPYTQAIAHEHGWRWKIPLQNRTGNGYVYCSDYCDDDSAIALLKANVKEKTITEPRIIHFTTGKREQIWHKNCLAVGLSAGFLEPLESTSINLIVKGMLDFVDSIPNKNLHQATINEYNRLMDIEYQCIRDFIVLHYCKTARTDSPFWQRWQTAEIPESLQTKIALFEGHGRLYTNDLDLFTSDSWYAVLEGMKVRPQNYDPLVDASVFEKIKARMPQIINELDASVNQLLSHDAYIEKYAK